MSGYRGRRALLFALGWAAAASMAAPAGAAASSGALQLSPHQALRGGCALDLGVGFAHCNLLFLGDRHGRALAMAAPSGYGPADLQSAYALASAAQAGGGGQTVALVDAYDDKSAESDLATYRSHYGLAACTTADGCFGKVNQSGVQGSYPANNQGWALEISLDLEMVSAICPNCHILLVEANSNANSNLYAAEDTAARLGATEISNSYGGRESSLDLLDDSHFNHPGVAITASTGDKGYGVEYPSSSPYVTAVGGTTLTRASNARGWNESVWSGSGSGCSAYEVKEPWQSDACAHRTVADVSAVADPNTGVSVYDSNCGLFNRLLGKCFKGWGVVGGTSASSPLIASVYALAGNASGLTYGAYPYTHTGSLNDVTTGSNGTCTPAYLCTAGPQYDGPSGLGTPNGTGAF